MRSFSPSSRRERGPGGEVAPAPFEVVQPHAVDLSEFARVSQVVWRLELPLLKVFAHHALGHQRIDFLVIHAQLLSQERSRMPAWAVGASDEIHGRARKL